MTTPRPWWASDGPTDPASDQDPVDLHRAARRGMPPPTGSEPPSGRSGSAAGPDDGSHAVPPGAPRDPLAEVCGVCPICIAARVVGETRPELLEHLAEAGRHLGAAVRSLLDPGVGSRDAGPAAQGSSDGASADGPCSETRVSEARVSDRLRRIDLDRPPS